MKTRLQVDPQDEKELVALKEEIANHEKNITHYLGEMAKITEYLEILENNSKHAPQELYEQYFS